MNDKTTCGCEPVNASSVPEAENLMQVSPLQAEGETAAWLLPKGCIYLPDSHNMSELSGEIWHVTSIKCITAFFFFFFERAARSRLCCCCCTWRSVTCSLTPALLSSGEGIRPDRTIRCVDSKFTWWNLPRLLAETSLASIWLHGTFIPDITAHRFQFPQITCVCLRELSTCPADWWEERVTSPDTLLPLLQTVALGPGQLPPLEY